MHSPTGILSTGSYLPEEVVGNEEIARGAGVTDEWIVRKTGIRERRRAAAHEATSDLAAEAARRAIEQAGLEPSDVSYIVVATSTPDHPQPATASLVQNLIGAHGAACFDINAVCSGFVYALTVTERMLRADGGTGHGVVVGADIYSRILDYTDRKTAILFGDGAGAAVLGPVSDGHGVLTTELRTRGDEHGLISVPAGGSRLPASADTLDGGGHFFRMDGRGVRSFVHDNLPGAVRDLLVRSELPGDRVAHFVPHQANGVMLTEVWPELGLGSATLHLSLERYGNTGAASVPVTLDAVHRAGLLAESDLVLLAAFGGGMSLGAALLDWAPTAHAAPPALGRPLAATGAH
ncbi:beta-ketoacyl-ACP synthase 3 [Streptomyces sp. A3M-1-3]|uniref:3-oxoacyl-ACP synthase III family protein n=1 Tax=Streptomyces sp. A3M-1-3 TaxID=2962044 RepID=UPI0020B8E288|nr:beta-ketoacyl-ACP synthase 3 [Streptomyces sp. A3M-1-3]MCP3821645.1 beta-ketoacyl-ACP synthase 3 [Streptomyces sp. A3M-1-3]